MLTHHWTDKFKFSPVLDNISDLKVLNLEEVANVTSSENFGIGKYNEVRKNMYTSELFAGHRNIHMGIDLSGQVDAPVYSFYDGEIFASAYHPAQGDYGHTIIIKYEVQKTILYALYGHLGAKSIALWGKKRVGQCECIGYLGAAEENGGWPPHLHFQLGWEAPIGANMPGAVSMENRDDALTKYPDPRIVLGKLY